MSVSVLEIVKLLLEQYNIIKNPGILEDIFETNGVYSDYWNRTVDDPHTLLTNHVKGWVTRQGKKATIGNLRERLILHEFQYVAELIEKSYSDGTGIVLAKNNRLSVSQPIEVHAVIETHPQAQQVLQTRNENKVNDECYADFETASENNSPLAAHPQSQPVIEALPSKKDKLDVVKLCDDNLVVANKDIISKNPQSQQVLHENKDKDKDDYQDTSHSNRDTEDKPFLPLETHSQLTRVPLPKNENVSQGLNVILNRYFIKPETKALCLFGTVVILIFLLILVVPKSKMENATKAQDGRNLSVENNVIPFSTIATSFPESSLFTAKTAHNSTLNDTTLDLLSIPTINDNDCITNESSLPFPSKIGRKIIPNWSLESIDLCQHSDNVLIYINSNNIQEHGHRLPKFLCPENAAFIELDGHEIYWNILFELLQKLCRVKTLLLNICLKNDGNNSFPISPSSVSHLGFEGSHNNNGCNNDLFYRQTANYFTQSNITTISLDCVEFSENNLSEFAYIFSLLGVKMVQCSNDDKCTSLSPFIAGGITFQTKYKQC